MNFVSKEFFIFLCFTWIIFYALPSRFRLGLLLSASYIFYATWSISFILVILITTTFDYWMSQIIDRNRLSPVKLKLALISGIVLNLSCLCFFKYINFILLTTWNLTELFNIEMTLPHHLNILLPLGISFYTFEALSYLIDVYRGQPPAKNLIQYNFYIMYFPHLISGPIIRFNELACQYQIKIALPSLYRFRKGLVLIILGYLFKICIADQMAGIVEPVFNSAQTVTPLETWIGVLAFTVQIYFDFMGYTHIARGVSLLFNLELPLNFNHPYVASNISDFWHRWHITLSRWIKDYLYIPLGGSRRSLTRICFNLIVVMGIAGAWHGAGWSYIIWGLYHGSLLALYHIWKMLVPVTIRTTLSKVPFYSLLMMFITFLAVVIGWVFFRSSNLETSMTIINHMWNLKSIASEVGLTFHEQNLLSIATIIYLLFLCFSGPWLIKHVKPLAMPLPYWAKASAAFSMGSIAWILAADDVVPFIYFQF